MEGDQLKLINTVSAISYIYNSLYFPMLGGGGAEIHSYSPCWWYKCNISFRAIAEPILVH